MSTHNEDSMAFLHAHGINVKPSEFSQMVEEAISSLPRDFYPHPPQNDLTPEEAAVLERGGLDLTPRDLGRNDPLAKTATTYAALLETSLSTGDVAEMLGVNKSRVRQRLTSRPPTLYGLRVRSSWHIPTFQFVDGRLIPGMEKVVAKLDSEVHPISFFSWFSTPCPDLALEDGIVLSPREWLLCGFSPDKVAELVTDL